MTVIAYRDGVMAGDSLWSDSSDEGKGLVCNLQNKIMRLASGALYGGSGATDDRTLVQALAEARDSSDFPSAKKLRKMEHGSVLSLVVLPDGSMWCIGTGKDYGGVEPVQHPFFAIGSGSHVALGAMQQGASAKEAVAAACRWNIYCREPIHILKLKP